MFGAAVRDARIFQIASLGGVLALQIAAFDLGADPLQAAVSITATLATQALFCGLLAIPFDWRSPLITALSLTLLLRAHDPLIWIAAGFLAMASKFLVRLGGKHVFNPACLAIVALLLLTDQVWVSPGLWGSAVWTGFLLASLAALVLTRSNRLDTATAFFATYTLLLLARALTLGDPIAIPLHQLQSGSLLLFGFFMITDPRSTPDDRAGRLLFASIVAVLAVELQYRWQIRTGLFYALAIASPLVPIIDRLRPAARFRWTAPQGHVA